MQAFFERVLVVGRPDDGTRGAGTTPSKYSGCIVAGEAPALQIKKPGFGPGVQRRTSSF